MAIEHETKTKRRGFLRQVATLAGAAPLGTRIAGGAGLAVAMTTPASVARAADVAPIPVPIAGYQFFGPDEAAFVEALVNVMCPADQYTPSGVECGLATFMDRQLAGAFGQGEGRYLRGPWKQGKPQLGPQLPLTPAQYFVTGLAVAQDTCARKYGKTFEQLSAVDSDAFLRDLQSGKHSDRSVSLASWFNDLVYPLFVQSCFADPLYGGNNDKVFWTLVGYPGLPATHTLDMVRYRGKPYPGAKDPKSIVDFS
jgi:gluconate 2-dehydrogenase gamma chain